jgi:hypothetical protein
MQKIKISLFIIFYTRLYTNDTSRHCNMFYNRSSVLLVGPLKTTVCQKTVTHKDYLYGSPYRNAVTTTCDVWSRLLQGRCGIIDGSLEGRRKRASYSAKPTLAMITAVLLASEWA